MELEQLRQTLGRIDIYVLDQILRGKVDKQDAILDAGCGGGRNIWWLMNHGYNVYGVDRDDSGIEHLQKEANQLGYDASRFQTADLSQLPFNDGQFNYVICSAVLHFAHGIDHFRSMLDELSRVLSVGGTLFIRMTSDIGLETDGLHHEDGCFDLRDGSRRFLVTRSLLDEITAPQSRLAWKEPLKTVNVNDLRCMSTMVFIRR